MWSFQFSSLARLCGLSSATIVPLSCDPPAMTSARLTRCRRGRRARAAALSGSAGPAAWPCRITPGQPPRHLARRGRSAPPKMCGCSARLDPQREGQRDVVLEGRQAGHDVPAVDHAVAPPHHRPERLPRAHAPRINCPVVKRRAAAWGERATVTPRAHPGALRRPPCQAVCMPGGTSAARASRAYAMPQRARPPAGQRSSDCRAPLRRAGGRGARGAARPGAHIHPRLVADHGRAQRDHAHVRAGPLQRGPHAAQAGQAAAQAVPRRNHLGRSGAAAQLAQDLPAQPCARAGELRATRRSAAPCCEPRMSEWRGHA